jgi:thiol-disulfide isomerase/thioredoxin
MMMGSLEEFKATQLLKDLSGLAGNYVSADSAPDEVLEIGGRSIPCYVVRLGANSLKKPMKPGARMEETIWIAKDDFTIRRVATRRHAPSIMSPALFEDTESTDLYPVVELGGAIAESEFAFHPPAAAALVEKFADPFAPGPSLQGKSAPAVTFKSAGGKETALASYRGKPVLLDFWATWCAPCVAAMPEMAKIYQETNKKGLVFISVDKDFDAKTATDFLAKKEEPWPNYHDDGAISNAFKENGLPFTVLIDAQGKVVYSEVGYGNSGLTGLREAIAGLGPEYAAVKTAAP